MHILIAEDDKNACEMYRILLKSRGHGVKITGDGRECLQTYRECLGKVSAGEPGPFDVVILDYQLPSLDGLELTEMILRLRPTQRIIIASAHVGTISTNKVEGLQGFIEIMAKPFEPKNLVEMVENPSKAASAQKLSTLVTLIDINSRSISGEGILKGLDALSKVFGPKVMPSIMAEFYNRGLAITTMGADKKHSGEELLSVLESVFGASNKAFCVRFFLDFFD